MRTELTQARDQVSVLEQGLEKKGVELTALMERVERLETENKMIPDLTQDRDNLQAQVEQDRVDLDKAMQQFGQVKTSLQASITQLEQTAESRMSQVQASTARIESLEQSFNDAQKANEELQLIERGYPLPQRKTKAFKTGSKPAARCAATRS